MKGEIGVAVKISKPLKRLLKASVLGRNKNHPLAGWNVLMILYHDGGSGTALTLNFLLDKYNRNYLEADERPLSDAVLKEVLRVVSEDARLVDVAPRKVRMPMRNGGFHMQQSYVYRITSSGIEYLSMMQKVVEAESTVTANIARINEFCDYVHTLNVPQADLTSTGIWIAAQFFSILKHTTAEQLLAIQTPQQVVEWLSLYGKISPSRTHAVTLELAPFQDEANTIHVLECFVEQEQLIGNYEQLIGNWLQ